mmetsp:Transcript_10461/g.63959  ORF Transcript_10461/g.63959 Transcript_10461/m.63959 type:complete len:336 (-) Transcript_10461:227-1234(-)
MGRKGVDASSLPQVPQPAGVVFSCGGHGVSVLRHVHGQDRFDVSGESMDMSSGAQVPHPSHGIQSPAHAPGNIALEGQGVHGAGKSFLQEQFRRGLHIPQAPGPIEAGRGQVVAIGMECDACHSIGVSLVRGQVSSTIVPPLGGAIAGSRGSAGSIHACTIRRMDAYIRASYFVGCKGGFALQIVPVPQSTGAVPNAGGHGISNGGRAASYHGSSMCGFATFQDQASGVLFEERTCVSFVRSTPFVCFAFDPLRGSTQGFHGPFPSRSLRVIASDGVEDLWWIRSIDVHGFVFVAFVCDVWFHPFVRQVVFVSLSWCDPSRRPIPFVPSLLPRRV